MGYAKVTLFEPTPEGQIKGAPVHAEANFDSDFHAFKGLKVTITCGDDCVAGTVALPLDILSILVKRAMEERARHAPIVLPQPHIIKPN